MPFSLFSLPLLKKAADEYLFFNLGGVNFDLRLILIGLTLGLMLACIFSTLQKRQLGRFFDALRASGAASPDSAKTLAELGLPHRRGLLKRLLSPISLYRKLIFVVLPDGKVIPPIASLDDEGTTRRRSRRTRERDLMPLPWEKEDAEEAPLDGTLLLPPNTAFDPSSVRYYMDARHRRRAEVRYAGRQNEWAVLAISLIVLGALLYVLLTYFPAILGMLDTLLSDIFGGK